VSGDLLIANIEMQHEHSDISQESSLDIIVLEWKVHSLTKAGVPNQVIREVINLTIDDFPIQASHFSNAQLSPCAN
jgi:hypothetical protein